MSPKQFCEELGGFIKFCEQPPTEQQWCVIKRQLEDINNTESLGTMDKPQYSDSTYSDAVKELIDNLVTDQHVNRGVMSEMAENALRAIDLTYKL